MEVVVVLFFLHLIDLEVSGLGGGEEVERSRVSLRGRDSERDVGLPDAQLVDDAEVDVASGRYTW